MRCVNRMDVGAGLHLGGWSIEVEDAKPQKPWKKDQHAFDIKEGVCYVDKSGNSYTYADLFALTMDEEWTAKAFEYLHGNALEEDLDDAWCFEKCQRCGGWIYNGGSKRAHIHCKRCAPVRTNGKISVIMDPYEDDRKFYRKKTAVFKPGLTTIVGCNGIGKTTLLKNIQDSLAERGTPCILFDNVSENGGQNLWRGLINEAMVGWAKDAEENLGIATTMMDSSEGEKIAIALGRFSDQIVAKVQESNSFGELWVLVGAIDSGLSCDMIEDIKKYVFDRLLALSCDGLRVYIIVSSNSYEISEGTMCFSVHRMGYVPIRSYSRFTKEVKASRAEKDKRDHILRLRAEISRRPCDFTVNEAMINSLEGDRKCEGDLITLDFSGYVMKLHAKVNRRSVSVSSSLIRRSDGKNIPVRGFRADAMRLSSFHDIEEMKDDMLSYLCRYISLQEIRKK